MIITKQLANTENTEVIVTSNQDIQSFNVEKIPKKEMRQFRTLL